MAREPPVGAKDSRRIGRRVALTVAMRSSGRYRHCRNGRQVRHSKAAAATGRMWITPTVRAGLVEVADAAVHVEAGLVRTYRFSPGRARAFRPEPEY